MPLQCRSNVQGPESPYVTNPVASGESNVMTGFVEVRT